MTSMLVRKQVERDWNLITAHDSQCSATHRCCRTVSENSSSWLPRTLLTIAQFDSAEDPKFLLEIDSNQRFSLGKCCGKWLCVESLRDLQGSLIDWNLDTILTTSDEGQRTS